MASDQPRRVGRYDILVPIASGGMATVYLARLRLGGSIERPVALKLTHQHLCDTEEFAGTLLAEAKLAARIAHQNVVPVRDLGEAPEGLFLVMDYVEGDTLAALLRWHTRRGEAMPARVAARILLDALAGLQAAHELRDDDGAPLGVVHRDFTPHNLLVGVDGVTRLTDFGIAKAAQLQAQRTATGHIKGKLAYLSPEQARGEPLDARSDLWAAGVVAREMLTGVRMFVGDEVSVLLRLLSEPLPGWPDDRPVPAAAARAIDQALQRDRDRRWSTAADMRRALLEAFPDGVASHAEVGEMVRRLAGPRLAARRQRASEARATLAAAPAPSDPASPGPAAPDPTPAAPPADPGPDALATSPVPATARTAAPVSGSIEPAAAGSSPPPRWARPALLAAVAAGGVLVGSTLQVTGRRDSPASAAALASPERPAASPGRPLAGAGSPGAGPERAAGETRSVWLVGSTALASVRLGEQTHLLAPAATQMRLELPGAEAAQAEVTAADGRRASVSLPAGASSVRVTFAASRPSASRPLLPNPYAR